MEHLSTLLEERVADVPVGAPPIDAMRASVRRRHGRTAVLAAAAAVVVIAAGTVVWRVADASDPQPPVASDPPADRDTPPDGYRYVGIGTAVIAVPESWGTNDVECGTPTHDTVIIDQGVTCLMLVPRPGDVDSVEIRSGAVQPAETYDWTPVEIDGEQALRSPNAVVSDVDGAASSSASVYLPARHVTFVAESSASYQPALVTEALLESITILQEHTTVPGFQDLSYDRDPKPAAHSYVQRLQELGLTVEVLEEKSDLERGTVLSTDPAVGSVVAPGDTVMVTVAR